MFIKAGQVPQQVMDSLYGINSIDFVLLKLFQKKINYTFFFFLSLNYNTKTN